MIKNNFINMKKKILGLIVLTLFITFLGAGLVSADDPLAGCKMTDDQATKILNGFGITCTLTNVGSLKYCNFTNTECGMCCMINIVYNITNWVFVILMSISSLMIIWGAVMFTTSAGDPEKTGKARQLIIYAAVGIVVALFSQAIPMMLKFVVGV